MAPVAMDARAVNLDGAARGYRRVLKVAHTTDSDEDGRVIGIKVLDPCERMAAPPGALCRQ